MIKLCIYDLDGVLVSSKDCHYQALNKSLEEIDSKYAISKEEHLTTYDGLPTREKLKILHNKKGLPEKYFEQIWKRKQELTCDIIKENVEENPVIINLFREIKSQGIKIYVASNAIRNTVASYLVNLGLITYVDYFISNEDIKKPKPNPEMYLTCIARESLNPKEVLIIEDSSVGIRAATDSGANVLMVKNPSETDNRILKHINKLNKTPMRSEGWTDNNLNILIPMAGEGSRFADAGYTFPKPLIEINQKPMIQVVVENININANYIYVVRKKHYDEYNLKYVLNAITPGCKIVIQEGKTEGAACSVLLAKKHINNDMPLIIANSDQYVEYDSNNFMYSAIAGNSDGCIQTFTATHSKWSYAKVNDEGYVTEVAEKKPISTHATTGIYYYRKGKYFVEAAEEMIKKDIRHNNEFYVAPCYNQMINKGMKITIYDVDRMWGIGTPEDLTYFNNNFKYE
jgi:HAD superfamily hydrolase (TIGR01509 family)